MNKILIQNPRIINEGRSFIGSVLVEGDKIAAVFEGEVPGNVRAEANQVIDATGKWLIPGVIDDQVHFRDPGLTHKGDIGTESRAAVAGGVTTFMDMPNTKPQTTTIADLEWKFNRAAEVSRANYSFFFGGTNDNMDEIRRLDRSRVPGLKLFLGSSTGNMLVDKKDSLERIFGEAGMLIAIHAEKEEVIRRNIQYYTNLHGEDLDISFHSKIRSEKPAMLPRPRQLNWLPSRFPSAYSASFDSKRTFFVEYKLPISEKKITGEVCVHHLWFYDGDYEQFGNRIKWNPSIKTLADRTALREAVNNNTIDIVATDHAPHLLSEKEGSCLKAASGGPLIQHSLIVMLELAMEGRFTYEKVVEKMAHMPSELFRVDRRGYIRPGYYADLVLVDPKETWTVAKENILYKCGWSPFEGYTFHHGVWKTFVNGELAYGDGVVNDAVRGKEVRYL